MARGLYDTEPVFRENFDRCAAGFAEELGIDLKAQVFDGDGGQERSDSGKGRVWSPPTWPSRRCSRWNTPWRN